jgi:hypothetical protein
MLQQKALSLCEDYQKKEETEEEINQNFYSKQRMAA